MTDPGPVRGTDPVPGLSADAPPGPDLEAVTGARSLGDALRALARCLTDAGIEGAPLDARVLAAHAAGESAAGLIAHAHRPLEPGEGERMAGLLARRLAREPVAQIVGRREFWSLPFRVTRDVLTPRPDSEAVIEAACARWPDRATPLSILDLGTGSGCLLLALLHEYPAARGHGRDISEAALAIARENAHLLGIHERATFSRGHWTDGVAGPVNLIVANPPYIETSACDGLDPEVAAWEPRGALDGGPDGLDAYRAIVPMLPSLLAPDGLALFEIGQGQGDRLAGLARASGLTVVLRHADLAGIERVIGLCHGRDPRNA